MRKLCWGQVITKMMISGMAAALLLAIYGSEARAVSVPISNHSFEAPNVGGSYAIAVPDSWVGVGTSNAFLENSAAVGFSGGDGTQYLGLDNSGSYIYQDLGMAFAANTVYTIDLASAHRDGFSHSTVEFGLFSSTAIGTDIGTPGFMDIQGVWSGSGNPSGDNQFNKLRDASLLHTIGTGTLGNVYSFTTGAAPPTGNVVVFVRDAGNLRVNIDNIRLDASAVPEPATLLLAGCGLSLTALRRRR